MLVSNTIHTNRDYIDIQTIHVHMIEDKKKEEGERKRIRENVRNR